MGLTGRENVASHSNWLNTFCIKLLWVISTDRFGDFVADEMIAPGENSFILVKPSKINSKSAMLKKLCNLH